SSVLRTSTAERMATGSSSTGTPTFHPLINASPQADIDFQAPARMDLANMRRQGVRHLIAYCLNDSCRHQAVIDVSSYPGDTLVPWFRSKVECVGGAAAGQTTNHRFGFLPGCSSVSLMARSSDSRASRSFASAEFLTRYSYSPFRSGSFAVTTH